jgi:FHS family glucose/mannose:H+ symporter-like MFS transporter
MKKLLWMGCLSYLLIGLAHVIMGSVLENLMLHYERAYSGGSQLIFNQFAGFLFGVLITPWVTSRLGRRGALLLSLGCLTFAQAIYSLLPDWGWMLTVAPLAGFGFGMVEAVIGAVIIEFFGEQNAVAMSRLEMFFGMGALLMPVIAGVLIVRNLWYVSFPFVGLVSLITLLLWAFMSFDGADKLLAKRTAEEKRTEPPRTYARGSLPLLGLMALFFLLYVGMEMSLVNFMPSILIERMGADQAMGTFGITLFWITMSVGRLFAGTLAQKIGYTRYLTASCLGTLIGTGLFLLAGNLWSGYLIILALGLVMAGIFAIGLILANELLPGMTERTTSILVASGGIGGAVLPRLMGWTMDAYPTVVSQWLLAVFALVLLLIIAVSARAKHSRVEPAKTT